jgi:diguanylate cyclase (GGDEF)-like protein
MAEAIHGSVRKSEIICRYGGDEFCVILPGASIQDAAKFGEKIRSLIANHPDLSYRTKDGISTIRVTTSIGVASVSGVKATEPGKLMKAADRALYRAKAGGRNQVCVYDPARDVIEAD